jgi:hypothetical protein
MIAIKFYNDTTSLLDLLILMHSVQHVINRFPNFYVPYHCIQYGKAGIFSITIQHIIFLFNLFFYKIH